LNAFFEVEEELMNGISIRYAVIDLFEDALFSSSCFSKESLHNVLGALYAGVPANVIGTQEKI